MQEDVRRILKVAAPFAGVALGWYLFMPNFRYMEMSGGDYKSQFLINLRQVQGIAQGLHYRLTTPKEVREWEQCRLDAGWTFIEIPINERWERRLLPDQFVAEQCGPDPRDDS